MISRTLQHTLYAIALASTLVSIAGWGGCRKSTGTDLTEIGTPRASVSENGELITFPPGNPGLNVLKMVQVRKSSVLLPVLAPARVVAGVSSTATDSNHVILFDSPDMTSLYSQYEQSVSNVGLAEKSLKRVREMYQANAATEKDLSQAEADETNARTAMREFESKLRAVGFQPAELEHIPPGTIWLISDVPESQLNEVQRGEEVDVYFTSNPGKKFTGRAVDIGGAIDPSTRTAKVRVTMNNPAGQFLPGMFARVDFGDPMSGVIQLSPTAVVSVEGKEYVFVAATPTQFRRREITTLNAADGRVVALHGLESGEYVVTDGAMLLKGLSFGF